MVVVVAGGVGVVPTGTVPGVRDRPEVDGPVVEAARGDADADAHHGERAEDVRAMPGGVHPRGHHGRRRVEALGDVLADPEPRVAAVVHALTGVARDGRRGIRVVEVVVEAHVQRLPLGRRGQGRRQRQRAEAVGRALLVELHRGLLRHRAIEAAPARIRGAGIGSCNRRRDEQRKARTSRTSPRNRVTSTVRSLACDPARRARYPAETSVNLPVSARCTAAIPCPTPTHMVASP